MLAMPTRTVPAGESWSHEVKWDGMRVIADVHGGSLRLFSRTERDVSVAFPELAGLGAEYADMALDGEVVVLRDGRPSFASLAERFHVTDPRRAARLAEQAPVTLMAFDLLRLYGTALLERTWTDRRATLERLELDGPRWQTPPTFVDGRALHTATREQGLEGVVSKRVASPYLPGRRSSHWLKAPHRTSVSVVIGGWRPEAAGAGRGRLGAVLVGLPGPGGLRFVGRVGAGLAGRAGAALLERLGPLSTEVSPFEERLPALDAAGAAWVCPVLVADVESLGLGAAGRLRQPAFKGLRTDLAPGDLEAATS